MAVKCIVSSLVVFGIFLISGSWLDVAEASGNGESASWERTTVSSDSMELAYSYCTPSSESKWVLDSAFGTSVTSAEVLNTVTTYGFASSGNTVGVSILEEDAEGVVSTETFYNLYNLERSSRINGFLELLKKECVTCQFSIDPSRNAIKRSHSIKDLGQGNYWQLVDYIYLTNPSPHKSNVPVYVNFSYSIRGTSASASEMDTFTEEDWKNADGLFKNYLKAYPNKL